MKREIADLEPWTISERFKDDVAHFFLSQKKTRIIQWPFGQIGSAAKKEIQRDRALVVTIIGRFILSDVVTRRACRWMRRLQLYNIVWQTCRKSHKVNTYAAPIYPLNNLLIGRLRQLWLASFIKLSRNLFQLVWTCIVAQLGNSAAWKL